MSTDNDTSGATEVEEDIPDVVLAQVSDYVDGVLPPDARAGVKAKIEADPLWKRAHAEMALTRDNLSGLQKARAPAQFDQDVTDIIRKRSAGAFFGRRTFGDRVPFGALLILAVLGLAALGYVLYSSSTGSLKRDAVPEQGSAQPSIAPKI